MSIDSKRAYLTSGGTVAEQWIALNAHRSSGYAVHGGAFFDAPLVSHIIDNLWMGGVIHGVRLPDDFEFVLSLYPWEEYELGPTTTRVQIKMLDSDQVDETEVYRAADLIGSKLHAANPPILVHCQAGLNRSALVASLALMVYQGHSAREAINLIRDRRNLAALCNRTFEHWLIEQEATIDA